MIKLHLTRGEGSIGLPNIRLYNLACLLRIGLDWIQQTSILKISLLNQQWLILILQWPYYILIGNLYALTYNTIYSSGTLLQLGEKHGKVRSFLPIQTLTNPRKSQFLPGNGLSGLQHLGKKMVLIAFYPSDIDTGQPLAFSALARQFALPNALLFTQFYLCFLQGRKQEI